MPLANFNVRKTSEPNIVVRTQQLVTSKLPLTNQTANLFVDSNTGIVYRK